MADFREDRRSRALLARLPHWLSLFRGKLHRIFLAAMAMTATAVVATRIARSRIGFAGSRRERARARARAIRQGERFEISSAIERAVALYYVRTHVQAPRIKCENGSATMATTDSRSRRLPLAEPVERFNR